LAKAIKEGPTFIDESATAKVKPEMNSEPWRGFRKTADLKITGR
jgi:hypothetical protein